MVMYFSQGGEAEYHPVSDIGKPDGNSEVTAVKQSHQFKPVMLGTRHGWRCEVCGYEEIVLFFGKTPPCKGIAKGGK